MNQNTSTQAIALHGFLGSPEDFKFLEQHYDLLALDLKPKMKNQEHFESWQEMSERAWHQIRGQIEGLESFKTELIFFSYSMGSKVLTEWIAAISSLAVKKKLKTKFVFLSSHFGLYENDELQKDLKLRTDMNRKFLFILAKENLRLFRAEWNSLELFKLDQLTTNTDNQNWNLDQIQWYFNEWNRSQVVLDFTNIEAFKKIDQILVFYGSEDLKYKVQALRFESLMKNEGVKPILTFELVKRSHRLLTNKDFEIIYKKIVEAQG